LFAPAFVRFLVSSIVDGARNPDALDGAPVVGDSVRLLLNLCIIQRNLVHAALLAQLNPPAAADESKQASAAAASSSSTSSSPSSSLAALVSSLPLLRNSASDRELVFFFVRVLLFLLVEPRLAREAIERGQLYEHLLRTVLDYSEGERVGVDLTKFSPAGSVAAAAAPAAAAGESFALPAENRKVVVETLKVLTNLAVLAGSDFPGLHDALVGTSSDSAAASAAAASASSSASGSALYTAFLDRLAALLRCSVGDLPAEVLEGYEGDPVVTEAVAEAQKVHAAQVAERARLAAEEEAREGAAAAAADPASASSAAQPDAGAPKRSDSPTSLGAASPSASARGAVSPSAAAAAPAAIRVPRVQRQQTAIILAALAEERRSAPSGPTSASLVQVQRDVATVLLGKAERDAIVPRLEADECKPFHALIQLLHRQLIQCATDPAQKREVESLLTPLLQVLAGLVRSSPALRAHAKRAIFLDLARAPAAQAVSAAAGAAVGANKKFDASQYAMMPAGALSEKVVDPDPLCLRALLLAQVITLHFDLKRAVSEFLYAVVGEDTSEYVRLLGFGSAVGLLAEKGLPGFAGLLKQKAINMDEVIRSGKKL